MGQGGAAGDGGHGGVDCRGTKAGRVCVPGSVRSSSPVIPGPPEVTGQDLPFRGNKGGPARTPNLTRSTRIPVPSPATAGCERGRRRTTRVSRPAGGSQRWHWGHRVRRGSGQTRESRPGPSQSRYGWVGGEMPFKGPGRWLHVHEPGPGSRRRRSSSGSVPRAGWGRGGRCPVLSAWSPLPRDAAITCKGTAAPPATCVPLKSIQASHPRKGGRGW